MSTYHKICQDEVTKLMLLGNSDRRKALFDRYGSEVYGQFKSFCREDLKAGELTENVFDLAIVEVENDALIKGSIFIWLLKISRKVARTYLVDYSVKAIGDDRCVRKLVISEGFSLLEAASLLGISTQEAINGLRKALKK